MGDADVDERTMDCGVCGLTIAAPTVMAYEPSVRDPLTGAVRFLIHVGPNDVEYQMHAMTCKELAQFFTRPQNM